MKRILIVLVFAMFFVLRSFSQNRFDSTTFYCHEYTQFSCWGGGNYREYTIVGLKKDSTFSIYQFHLDYGSIVFNPEMIRNKKVEAKGRYSLRSDSSLKFQIEAVKSFNADSLNFERSNINYLLNGESVLSMNNLKLINYLKETILNKISFVELLKIEAEFFAHNFTHCKSKYNGTLSIKLK